MSEKPTYLPPPRPLLTRNPLRWLQFFGPGAVIASLTIGSGELVFPSRIGAMFGYKLLWIFPLVALMKWVMSYCSMRHLILSGAQPMERWNHLPGPRGWVTICFFTIFLICAPFWAFFMQQLLSSHCASVFPQMDLYTWATIWVTVSFVLLAVGSYKFLEKVQMTILGVMLVCALIAVIYVQPSWLEVCKGFFVFLMPEYPSWVAEKYQDKILASEWLEFTVAASVIGGAAFDYLGYASFLREKRWGRSDMGAASHEELNEIAVDERHVVRLWVRAALIDTALSMVMVVVIAASFSILGAVILQPQRLVPTEDHELLLHQAVFLTKLSPMLLPLYNLAVALAFFGNVYGGPELYSHICVEGVHSMPRRWEWLTQRRIRWCTILWVLFGGFGILWLKRLFPDTRVVEILTFPAIYTGILMCGFYCLVNPWVDWHFLPAPLRMNKLLVVLNLVAGVIFCIIGVKAMWDQTMWHFVLLPGWMLASMLVAYLLRSRYESL